MDEKYQRVVDFYKATGNIKRTARENGISIIKVRRILITEGLWSSETSDAIKPLWEQGFSAQEIADKLQLSLKSVQAYTPYSRGIYDTEVKTIDAKRCEVYRRRKESALKTQVLYGYDNYMKNSSPIEIRRNNNQQYNDLSDAPEKAMRLRLELVGSGAESNPILKRYGKVNKSISRTVLIPGSMNFHALHFLIQKAFGWGNRRYHHFSLERDTFMWITNDYFRNYMKLCGIYFRFPDEQVDDMHWNDDYKGDKSFASWLREKYCGPYYYLGYQDHYSENVLATRRFNAKHKYEIINLPLMYDNNRLIMKKGKFRTDLATVKDVAAIMNFPRELNYLCERLPVRQVMAVKDQITEDPQILAKRAATSHFCCDYEKDEWAKMYIFRAMYFREQMENPWDKDYDELQTWDLYQKNALETTPDTYPIVDNVIYHYDYEEKWEVRVTCEEVYYENSDGTSFTDRHGNVVDEKMQYYLKDYIMKEIPVCLEKDGLPVLDDTCGVQGYCEFLKWLNEAPDEEDRKACKEWANRQGWTGRDVKSKNLF